MFSGCGLVYQVAQVCRLDGLLSTLCPRELSSRALNQIPYPLWIDSSCGIQGPQPGGTCFASSYLATPFLTTALILYTFLPSFVLFLLPPELRPPPRAVPCCLRSRCRLSPLAFFRFISPSAYTRVLVITWSPSLSESTGGAYCAVSSPFVSHSVAGIVVKLWGQMDFISKLTIYLPGGFGQDI